MSVQPQYLAYVLEQLAAVGALRSNRMFGGVGLYCDGLFFGFIDDDTLFFKADARNLDDYVSRNMPRFMPDPARPAATTGYYQVPADVIEDAEALVAWARKSVAVALSAQAAKPRRKSKGRAKAKPKPSPKSKPDARSQAKSATRKMADERPVTKPAGKPAKQAARRGVRPTSRGSRQRS